MRLKENDYGNETFSGIQAGGGARGIDKRPCAKAGCLRFWRWVFDAEPVVSVGSKDLA